MPTIAPDAPPPKAVARQLANFYLRSGYGRVQNKQRYSRDGPAQYKKGDEIRLVVYSDEELDRVQELLDRAGFHAGQPFPKHSRWVQPIYGKAQVVRFLEMVDEHSDV
jgi:hypothetical protein